MEYSELGGEEGEGLKVMEYFSVISLSQQVEESEGWGVKEVQEGEGEKRVWG